jgi:penicillin-binding protein 1A
MTPYDSIKYHKQIMQTSFVAMEPQTGEVKAWVGGINFKWFKYDHVTANRQVGSTFKPLLYTLAVTDAGYGPQTYIDGGAVTMSGKTISFGGGTMAHCLAKSINGAAWRLMNIIGVKRTIEFAQSCGISVRIPPYPSIALGTAEIPMIQMLQSYTMFPNKGFNTPPLLVTRIEDKNGTLIQEFPASTSKELISQAEAYTMLKMMQGVVEFGTARRVNSYNIPAQKAGKTGTTNGNTDGWFIGYTPELLAGTWVGCEDPFIPIYSNNSGGAEMAAPKWGLFMEKVYADRRLPYSKIEFDQPEELKNDPVFADANFADIVNRGDSLESSANNGDENDFFSSDSSYQSDEIMQDDAGYKHDSSKKAKTKTTPAAKKEEIDY